MQLSKKIISATLLGVVSAQAAAESCGVITEQEVNAAQKTWGEAIVAIGSAFTEKKDFEKVASNTVDSLYGYEQGEVLFKPTKAAEDQFRGTADEAKSYFVKGIVEEDKGFAIQPWTNVRFENSDVTIDSDSALAMGNYFFTDGNTGKDAKVEYTFGYFKDKDCKLRINLHHSSFPYVAK